MNFDELLEPYKEAGKKDMPVERTMGTIVDYLINKKKFPPDIVGAAIFLVFMWLDSGGEFRGDGTYGSKGREMVTSLRIKCSELLKYKIELEMHKLFIEKYANDLKKIMKPDLKRKFLKWWRGKDVFA